MFDGAAVLPLAACVAVELVVDMVDVFEVVVVPLFDVAVFDVIVVAAELVVVVFALLAFAVVLFAVSPPQATPKAARPRSAESAIAFFMLKTVSCSSSKINLRFYRLTGRYCPKTLSIFGTNEMIVR